MPAAGFEPTTTWHTVLVTRTKTSWSTSWSTFTDWLTTTSTSISRVTTERVITLNRTVDHTSESTVGTTATITSNVTSTKLSVSTETGVNTRTSAVVLDPTTTTIEGSRSVTTQTTIIHTATTHVRTFTVTKASSFSSITTATNVLSVPVTNTQPLPKTTVAIITELSISTDVRTIFVVTTIVQVTTVAIETTRTITSSAFITTTSYITVSVAASEPPATQLVGLVTCTTRDINPTFTPSAPLPDNYTWGCPPSKICQPRQDSCNFEQDNPALTYFCSPEECIDAPALPKPGLSDRDYSCGLLYKPTPGYFELDPIPFGLGYWMFDINGQKARPCPAATTTTGWHDWTLRKGTFNEAPQRRQADPAVPWLCYEKCAYCNKVAQGTGRVEQAICPSDSEFQKSLDNCNVCVAYYKAGAKPDHAPPLLDQLHPFINVCSSASSSVALSGTIFETSSQTIGSAPTATAKNLTVIALAQRSSAQAAGAGIFALDAGLASQTRTVSMDVAATSGGNAPVADSPSSASNPAESQMESSFPNPEESGDPRVTGSTAEDPLSSVRPTEIPSDSSSVAKSPASATVYTGTGHSMLRTPSMAWLLLCLVGSLTG